MFVLDEHDEGGLARFQVPLQAGQELVGETLVDPLAGQGPRIGPRQCAGDGAHRAADEDYQTAGESSPNPPFFAIQAADVPHRDGAIFSLDQDSGIWSSKNVPWMEVLRKPEGGCRRSGLVQDPGNELDIRLSGALAALDRDSWKLLNRC